MLSPPRPIPSERYVPPPWRLRLSVGPCQASRPSGIRGDRSMGWRRAVAADVRAGNWLVALPLTSVCLYGVHAMSPSKVLRVAPSHD